ncbi:MAG: hypothetical protein AAFX87_02310 [Bacteroidota bacterium]
MDFVSIGLILSYILVVLAIIGAIVLPLINAIGDPKVLIKGLIGFLGLAVIFLIGWGLAGDALSSRAIAEGLTSNTSKLVGGALLTTWILLVVGIVGIVFTEISKVFK